MVELDAQQPALLRWTPSLRWAPALGYDLLARLAGLAAEVLPDSYPAGLRLALQAHTLFAAADQGHLRPPGPGIATYGPPWTALLLACSTACHDATDHALAVDLSHWALRVARALTEQVPGDPSTEELLRTCHDHHQELTGDTETRGRG